MDGVVHGVTKSCKQLSDFHFYFLYHQHHLGSPVIMVLGLTNISTLHPSIMLSFVSRGLGRALEEKAFSFPVLGVLSQPVTCRKLFSSFVQPLHSFQNVKFLQDTRFHYVRSDACSCRGRVQKSQYCGSLSPDCYIPYPLHSPSHGHTPGVLEVSHSLNFVLQSQPRTDPVCAVPGSALTSRRPGPTTPWLTVSSSFSWCLTSSEAQHLPEAGLPTGSTNE